MSDAIVWDRAAMEARFVRELQRTIQNSRRGARHEVMESFRGMLRFCFAVTPPMGGANASVTTGRNIRVNYAKGKEQGQRAIAKDLGRAFALVPNRLRRGNNWRAIAYWHQRFDESVIRSFLEQSPTQVLAWYKGMRNSKRRISGRPRMPMWESTVNWIYKELLKEQGLTASGWLTAAERFNVGGIPKWITRHGSKVGGSISISDTETAIQIVAKNASNHSDWMNVQQKIATAFALQANAMARRTANLIDRQRI